MSNNNLYEEKNVSIGITVILGIITLIMFGYFIGQVIYGPIGSKPAPTWVLALIFIVSLLTTINFIWIKIKLTESFINVSYGIFGIKRYWKDVTHCEIDEEKNFYGYGIRYGRYKKQWVWVYNVIGGPRIAFLTGKKKPKGLIISTKNPDEIMNIANKMIK